MFSANHFSGASERSQTLNYETSVELPCGDTVEISVTGSDVSVYVSDESVDTNFSASTAESLGKALIEAAECASENAKTQILRGKRFVLSGRFAGGREAVGARIRKAGGVVVGRVGAGTVVLTGDIPYSGTWKSKNAARFGATTKRYNELNAELSAVGI